MSVFGRLLAGLQAGVAVTIGATLFAGAAQATQIRYDVDPLVLSGQNQAILQVSYFKEGLGNFNVYYGENPNNQLSVTADTDHNSLSLRGGLQYLASDICIGCQDVQDAVSGSFSLQLSYSGLTPHYDNGQFQGFSQGANVDATVNGGLLSKQGGEPFYVNLADAVNPDSPSESVVFVAPPFGNIILGPEGAGLGVAQFWFAGDLLGEPDGLTINSAYLAFSPRGQGGGTAQVPEPATVLLFGTALVGSRLRRTSRKAA